MERDKAKIEAALAAAQEAQDARDIALRDLELALAGDDLDGIDELDLSTYDVDTIIEWADEQEEQEEDRGQ